jgi:hypothetical protein
MAALSRYVPLRSLRPLRQTSFWTRSYAGGPTRDPMTGEFTALPDIQVWSGDRYTDIIPTKNLHLQLVTESLVVLNSFVMKSQHPHLLQRALCLATLSYELVCIELRYTWSFSMTDRPHVDYPMECYQWMGCSQD